ncbi:hypothetical protein [Nocardiopsis synnemataformans]|uniref:hypothetical protein n=1 Tax=Nocardiopsis synnemataformans TaxID=61305 RepID=UPI003EBFBC5A
MSHTWQLQPLDYNNTPPFYDGEYTVSGQHPNGVDRGEVDVKLGGIGDPTQIVVAIQDVLASAGFTDVQVVRGYSGTYTLVEE